MEDLQSLLEKINRDGVEKADAQAAKIVADAERRAAKIVADAEAAAARMKADAEKAAADAAARGAESVRQAARDIILGVKDELDALFDRLLVKNVNRALADEQTAAALVADAIGALAGPGEIVCGEKLAKLLATQLAAAKSFTVVPDGSVGTGFTVRIDGGRVEHSFTGEVLAAELSRHLRPDLAKLVQDAN